MGLVDVVLRVEAAADPMLTVTAEHPGVRLVARAAGAGAAMPFALLGPPDEVRDACRFLEKALPAGALDRVEAASAGALLACRPDWLGALLEPLGGALLAEPAVVRGGVARLRVLVPHAGSAAHVARRVRRFETAEPGRSVEIVAAGEVLPDTYTSLLASPLRPAEERLLRLALELGYYESPRRCRLEDIATRMGRTVSPVHKRLKAVERQVLTAYVNPHFPPDVAAPEARRARRAARDAPPEAPSGHGGGLRACVSVAWPSFAATAFTEAHPGVTLVLHDTGENPGEGTSDALVVASGPPADLDRFHRFVDDLPGVRTLRVVDQTHAHTALLLRSAARAEAGTPDPVNPLPFLGRLLGADALLKPLAVARGQAWVHAVFLGAVTEEDVRARIDRASAAAGWARHALLHLGAATEAPDRGPAGAPITPRQEEVLRIAHALGYYETPRQCNLQAMAETLGVSANAIHKNLSVAESKVIRECLATLA